MLNESALIQETMGLCGSVSLGGQILLHHVSHTLLPLEGNSNVPYYAFTSFEADENRTTSRSTPHPSPTHGTTPPHPTPPHPTPHPTTPHPTTPHCTTPHHITYHHTPLHPLLAHCMRICAQKAHEVNPSHLPSQCSKVVLCTRRLTGRGKAREQGALDSQVAHATDLRCHIDDRSRQRSGTGDVFSSLSIAVTRGVVCTCV